MGFIDRMVSDLIRSATGHNVRPLVRMVGGKRLLTIGGAVIAGSLLSEKLQGQRGAMTPQRPLSPGTVPPPPPPASGATASGTAIPPPPPATPGAVPPPPPPAASGATAVPPPPPPPTPTPPAATSEADVAADEVELPPELVYAAVRTMIAAAHADGTIAEEEREIIDRHLAEAPLPAVQLEQVHRDLVRPADPATLAALVAGAAKRDDRALLYRLAAAVVLADRDLAAAERAWLDRLADALGLDDKAKASLETDLFSAQ